MRWGASVEEAPLGIWQTHRTNGPRRNFVAYTRNNILKIIETRQISFDATHVAKRNEGLFGGSLTIGQALVIEEKPDLDARPWLDASSAIGRAIIPGLRTATDCRHVGYQAIAGGDRAISVKLPNDVSGRDARYPIQ